MSIFRLAFSEEVALAGVCSRVPGGAAISTRGGPTSVGQIREDRHETGLDDSRGGEDVHAGLKVALRDATTL